LKEKIFIKKIVVLLSLITILNWSVQTALNEEYHYSSSNHSVLLCYTSITDSILSFTDFKNNNERKVFHLILYSANIIVIFIYGCQYLYKYQRKNQILLDKRKILFELFSNYFEGSIHK